MTKATFPTTVEALTGDWLTRTLRADGTLKQTRVSGFSVEPVSGGYTSRVFRLLLEYEEDPTGAPRSLVLKLHGNSMVTRERFEALGIYEKEVRFYQTLAQDPELPVPRCYAAEFDPECGDFLLLLEDLSAARAGSWEEDPVGDIRIALTHLAQLHANFWGDPRLDRYDWITRPDQSDNPSPIKNLWATDLAHAKKHYYDQFSASTWSVCERWLEQWDAVMSCMNQDTHTLVHTDAHLGQMFFPTPELPRFVLFDWQNPSSGWGAEDVIHAMVIELDVDDRRQHETELIDLYHTSLCRHGVSDLTRERLWFQCKLCLLWLFFMNLSTLADPDTLATLQAEAEESGEDWREWIFEQLEAAALDWNLSAILDQAIAEARG